jgi:hypothetical protein
MAGSGIFGGYTQEQNADKAEQQKQQSTCQKSRKKTIVYPNNTSFLFP